MNIDLLVDMALMTEDEQADFLQNQSLKIQSIFKTNNATANQLLFGNDRCVAKTTIFQL